MTSYELSLEDIESEISKIDSEIEFEKRYHKLINSKDFKEIFIDSIFGAELKELSDELCNTYNEDVESEIIKQIKAIKDFKYFVEKRSAHLDVLNSRLDEAKEFRKNILKQN